MAQPAGSPSSAAACGRTARARASPRPTGRRSRRCCGPPSPTEASSPPPSRATRRTAPARRSATRSRCARWRRRCWLRARRRRRSAWAASRRTAATPSRRRGWRGCSGWRRGCSRRRRRRTRSCGASTRTSALRWRARRARCRRSWLEGWMRAAGGRGGVSSFGYSGTIAHAVLEAAPPLPRHEQPARRSPTPAAATRGARRRTRSSSGERRTPTARQADAFSLAGQRAAARARRGPRRAGPRRLPRRGLPRDGARGVRRPLGRRRRRVAAARLLPAAARARRRPEHDAVGVEIRRPRSGSR